MTLRDGLAHEFRFPFPRWRRGQPSLIVPPQRQARGERSPLPHLDGGPIMQAGVDARDVHGLVAAGGVEKRRWSRGFGPLDPLRETTWLSPGLRRQCVSEISGVEGDPHIGDFFDPACDVDRALLLFFGEWGVVRVGMENQGVVFSSVLPVERQSGQCFEAEASGREPWKR